MIYFIKISMKTIQYNLEDVFWIKNKKVYHSITDLSNNGLINNFVENASDDILILLIKFLPDGEVNNLGYILTPIGNKLYDYGYDGVTFEYFIKTDWDEFHKELDSDKIILASKEGIGFIMEPVVLEKHGLKMDID